MTSGESPSHSRPRSRSRDAFIDATGDLLRRQGYSATGLAEIVDASGAPKGSLYFHFPGGKEELATAAMRRTAAGLTRAIEAVLARSESPADGVARLIDALAAGLQASDYADGCPIAATALESANTSEPLRVTAAEAFEAWLAAIEAALRAHGLKAATARERALLVLSAIEGALLLSRVRRDLAPLTAVRDQLRGALEAGAPGTAASH